MSDAPEGAESGPGWAKFTTEDTREDIDRKMAEAFKPVGYILEAMNAAFAPTKEEEPD